MCVRVLRSGRARDRVPVVGQNVNKYYGKVSILGQKRRLGQTEFRLLEPQEGAPMGGQNGRKSIGTISILGQKRRQGQTEFKLLEPQDGAPTYGWLECEEMQ